MSGRRNQRILKREEGEASPLKRPRNEHEGERFCLLAPDGTPATLKSSGESPDGNPAIVDTKVKRENTSVSSNKRRKTDPARRGWAWLLNPDGSPATVDRKKKSEEKLTLKKEAVETKTEPVRRGWYWLLAPDGTPATVGTKKRGNLPEIEDSNDDTLDEEEIGGDCGSNFISKQQHDQWEEKFRLIVEYKNKHKTTNVPCKHPTLGTWVHQQRWLFKSKRLEKYRHQRLESIGFVFDVFMSQWMEMYNQLASYKEKHGGSTNVPHIKKGSKNDLKLGRWVYKQQLCYATKKLSEEKISLLESLGFVWRLAEGTYTNTDRNAWMEMYQRLLAYKQKYKNTRVPHNFKADSRLAKWVVTQRKCCKEEGRIDLLNYIGFEWDPLEDDWMEMYRRLLAYKKQFENTRVPQRFKSDPKLGRWVWKQRKFCNDKNRVRQLNDIGFEWDR